MAQVSLYGNRGLLGDLIHWGGQKAGNEDYSPDNPWAGRTVESLTEAEKLKLLQGYGGGSDAAATGNQTPESILRSGSLNYTPNTRGDSLMDNLIMAGLAAGTGYLSGGFGLKDLLSSIQNPFSGGTLGPQSMMDVPPTDQFTAQAGDQLARAPTSAAPRFTGNPWQNVNIAGNMAPVETLPYTANPSTLSGLPGAGGVPYDPSSSPISNSGFNTNIPGMNQVAGPATAGGNMDLPAVDDWSNWMTNQGSPNVAPGGAMDMSGSVNSPTGEGLPGNLGTDSFPGLPGSYGSNFNIPSWLKMFLPSGMGGSSMGSGSPGGSLASLITGLLGTRQAGQQATSLSNLAQQYAGYGAPSRARYEASFAPGFSMANEPGFAQGLNLTARESANALSTGGNPAISPNAQFQNQADIFSKFAYPALQNYRTGQAQAGGLQSAAGAAPGLAQTGIAATANQYNPLAAAASDIFNPPKSLAQQIQELYSGGYQPHQMTAEEQAAAGPISSSLKNLFNWNSPKMPTGGWGNTYSNPNDPRYSY